MLRRMAGCCFSIGPREKMANNKEPAAAGHCGSSFLSGKESGGQHVGAKRKKRKRSDLAPSPSEAEKKCREGSSEPATCATPAA
jgi:hypothetical protein